MSTFKHRLGLAEDASRRRNRRTRHFIKGPTDITYREAGDDDTRYTRGDLEEIERSGVEVTRVHIVYSEWPPEQHSGLFD